VGRRGRILLGLGLFAVVAGVLAWRFWLEWAPKPEAEPLRLAKARFADLPGWGKSDLTPALAALRRSCTVLVAKPAGQAMGDYAGMAGDWRPACTAAASASDAKIFFEQWFAPVAVSAGGKPKGRFTGYFEPEIEGRRQAEGRFRTPVYGLPSDLISVDLGAFRPALKSERIAGKVEGGKLVPYAPRAEITAKGLPAAKVLFYTDDPIELFFLHIQGSGRAMLGGGEVIRVAYAGQNGQPYTAIGRTLIARGVPKNGMSLKVIRDWLNAHPDQAEAVMNSDASYVFFQEEAIGDAKLGAKGAEGVPLTPLASLAVDSRQHALGTPFYVAGPAPLGRLMIAQDIGGAIRGVVRGDVYFGAGKKAEAGAGGMNEMGCWFALLPKPVVQRLTASGTLK